MNALPNLTEDIRVRKIIRDALEEDIQTGDATSNALVPEKAGVDAAILSRGDYVVSGLDIACAVFEEVDANVECEPVVPDAQRLGPGDTALRLSGNARSILCAERTALNFLQRMSGIASLTADFVERVKPYGTCILDTRKTTPCLRVFEKYAVRCGGGENHRMGLFDRVLVKDNHRRLWSAQSRRTLAECVEAARQAYPDLAVEVEVEDIDELKDVLRAGPDWVLLDNMSTRELEECVEICRDRTKVEASGNVTLDTVAQIARTGVDAISVGCLTHSACAADFSLEMR